MRVAYSPIPMAVHEPDAAVSEVIAPSRPPSERECLLVLLPGIGDPPADFERHGFVSDAQRSSPACDVVLVDAHLMYYIVQTMVDRIAVDVLHEARRHGYRSVWLVGISLGGYGAVLTARAHPELVDGVILIAPMLGVPPREDGVAREIVAAGGLHRWRGIAAHQLDPRHHFREPRLVWDWLRQQTLNRPGRVVLAYGAEDRLGARHRLLARAMEPQHVIALPGEHDWETWRRLWREVLAAEPWS